MRIDGATGNVNILTLATSSTTTSPFVITSTTQYQSVDTKLFEVTYNGQAYAREIFVKVTSFPDYVFKKDYKLMPLNDVEKYYKANQHLPEVPSEKEVKENGLNVGDINVILLKKIEELTLYTVELEKKLKDLEEKINKIRVQKKHFILFNSSKPVNKWFCTSNSLWRGICSCFMP